MLVVGVTDLTPLLFIGPTCLLFQFQAYLVFLPSWHTLRYYSYVSCAGVAISH